MFAAATASSATAFAPERGTCKTSAKGKGKYLNATCTEPGEKGGAKKEFEWLPVSKTAAFTSTTGEATLKSFTPEGAELPPVTCNKSKSKGKILTATTSESVVTFEECSSSGEKCTGGTKAKASQIITKTLDGTLGTISGGTEAGEAVGGAGGGLSAEFKCGANEIKTEGATIGEVSPVNAKAATTSMLTFAATGSTQEFEVLNGSEHFNLQTEINGLGGGTFPFKSVEITKATVKGPALEVRAEGAAEPQKISIKPIEWGEGANAKKEKCPEKGGKVEFTKIGQWCEYEVKNENAKEKVEIETEVFGTKPECEGFAGGALCIDVRVPTANNPECNIKVKLAPKGGPCYRTVEYMNKPKPPAVESETYLRIETKSENNGVANSKVFQRVK
jgi:hypothetical protein